MARTTLDLDTWVLRQLRKRGRLEHKSMGQVASELLTQTLANPVGSDRARAFKWKAWKMGSPRVDLEDKEAVRRAIESEP